MHNDNEAATMAELETENRRLRSSLQKCQQMVEDCQAKLVATGEASAPSPFKARSSGSERRRGG
jgi:hypothetical protein